MGKKRHRRQGKTRYVFGSLFILFGCLLLFYPQIEHFFYDRQEKKLIKTFEQLAFLDDDVTYSQLEIGKEMSELAKEKRGEQLELIEGANGIIRIPKIDLEMIVFENASQSSLRNGAGLIEEDKKFGVNNVGIAGHRSLAYGKHFNRLGELSANDEIEILTKDGTFEFVIVETFVVDQREVSVLADKNEPYVTLVTCTPLGKKNPTDRLIVQAKLKQVANE